MNPEAQERRQRPRGEDILTRIEDVTYAILRNRPSNGADSAQQTLALAATSN